jgi:hypothetical protein
MFTNSTPAVGNQMQLANCASLLIEKANLINIFKLVVKDLIEYSLRSERRSIDKNSSYLFNFLDVFENILNHGIKGYIFI